MEDNTIGYDYPYIVIFSKDYEKAWNIQLDWNKGKYEVYTSQEMESSMFDALKKDTKKEYLYWGGYAQDELLSNKNEQIVINGMNSNEVTVKGDYFAKFKSSGLPFSMDELKGNVTKMSLS